MGKKEVKKYSCKPGCPLPLGCTRTGQGWNFSVAVPRDVVWCKLYLYEPGEAQAFFEVGLLASSTWGNVRAVEIQGIDKDIFEYAYEINGQWTADPYARQIRGNERFGAEEAQLRSVVSLDAYDWEEDVRPMLPMHEVVGYALHVRNFTMDASAMVRNRGTFAGIAERIPYLKDLGVNQIELMPAYAFVHTFPNKKACLGDAGMVEGEINPLFVSGGKKKAPPKPKLNVWGYGQAAYYAPQTAYCATLAPCREVKDLVKACHQAGIEVIMEFYFVEGTDSGLIVDCLRYWALSYHLDGFRVNGNAVNIAGLLNDPILADRKLYVTDMPQLDDGYDGVMLARSQDGFRMSMRRMLKGDEGQMSGFLYHLLEQSADVGVLNDMAGHNGMTLLDVVSYNGKHNDANGENNQDGCQDNASWNCGEEGPSTNCKIRQLRKRQLKNAWIMLLLAQGTPMIWAGDECGNSQAGNNNPYCLDNEISWVQWNGEWAKELHAFVRQLISFRKAHPVLHRAEPLRTNDTTGIGFPEISFHGREAWYLSQGTLSRSAGVLYCDAEQETILYIAYNFHWLTEKFALPKLPQGYQWHVILDTNVEGMQLLNVSEAAMLEGTGSLKVSERSIVILKAVDKGE